MKKGFYITALSLVLVSVGCKEDASDLEPSTEPIVYTVRLVGDWTKENFPDDYPDGLTTLSIPIALSHVKESSEGVDLNFINEGGTASAGLKEYAEVGNAFLLKREGQGYVSAGTALQITSGETNLETGVGNLTFELSVSEKHHMVTLITGISPSPDWFGAITFSMRESEDGFTLAQQKSSNVYLYDAGTDNGGTLLAGNSPNDPQDVVKRLSISSSLVTDAGATSAIARFVVSRKAI